MEKDVVAGLGEIGKPILQLISKAIPAIGYDTNPRLLQNKKFAKYQNLPTRFLHICIPYTPQFHKNVLSLYQKFRPRGLIIHSTIEPKTTSKIQSKLPIPVVYSATRGVHKRMLYDLTRYTKFFAVDKTVVNSKWASNQYSGLMKKCKVKTKQISTPLTLELAKIVVDTSYYGWLITYAQLSNMIAIQNKINYDEMWSFADEIHKFLGNRPKMFPGFIGGHCVIPNLDLINNDTLSLIKRINDNYSKTLKSINKH